MAHLGVQFLGLSQAQGEESLGWQVGAPKRQVQEIQEVVMVARVGAGSGEMDQKVVLS
jgi:hypothetical protein